MVIMQEVIKFKAFCLERYKFTHGLNGNEALSIFKQFGIMDFISSFYDVLHTFGDKYIVAEIDEYIENRKTN
jgi:hypothetical protein